MTASLEDILNGSVSQAAPVPQAAESHQPAPPEPEAEQPAQQAPANATGVTEATPQVAAPPAAIVEDTLDKKITAFQRKAEDETRKRQDYEKRLQDAERAIQERDAYIKQVNQAKQQATQPEPDLLDPQQAKEYFRQIAAQERQAAAEDQLVSKVVTSQELMRFKHDDYDELETIFAEEMEKDPSLQQKMFAAPLPAKFAYEHAKRAKAMREIGDDPTTFKDRIIQEYLASQGAQPPQVPTTPAKPVPQPPTSLAGVPSAARDVTKHPWKGPTPLSELLG